MPGVFTPQHRGGSGSPLVCIHGITDTWRTWDLVLAGLEARHDVLAPTLPGHAGGPPLAPDAADAALVDYIERTMDEAGFETADVVGNSLGGYVALRLAERGRARTVVAFAPGGGWAAGDDSWRDTLGTLAHVQAMVRMAEPFAERLLATPEGRRRATELVSVNYEHIPTELLLHQFAGVAACDGLASLLEAAERGGWPLDAARISCPVRVVWGTQDRLLSWPRAAERYRAELPQADWVVLDGVGHCPQLDVPLEATELILGFVGS